MGESFLGFLLRAGREAQKHGVLILIGESSRFMRGGDDGISDDAGVLLTWLESHPGPIMAATNRMCSTSAIEAPAARIESFKEPAPAPD